ncbi:MAG TPA: response regulator [Gemmatimonadales bacterium]|jgi:DNA-binding response OmpR family regulator|nr:response regulator [Gemmatimonadales bacterium]
MTPPAARRRVLFVEDEPALRISYERYFRDRFAMTFAATGAAALAEVGAAAPEVMVLDLRLPDTDGVAILRQVRATHPDLPVIVTSAYASVEPQLRMLDLAVSGYLIKPFDLADLGARIDAA